MVTGFAAGHGQGGGHDRGTSDSDLHRPSVVVSSGAAAAQGDAAVVFLAPGGARSRGRADGPVLSL